MAEEITWKIAGRTYTGKVQKIVRLEDEGECWALVSDQEGERHLVEEAGGDEPLWLSGRLYPKGFNTLMQKLGLAQ